jgi:hypothetical protein
VSSGPACGFISDAAIHISEFDAFARPLDMVEFDLAESNRTRWARGMQWFRVGLAGFALVLGGLFGWGAYEEFRSKELDVAHIVGVVLISFILGMFLYMAAIWRAPATRLTIDQGSIRMDYRRGPPYVLRWDDPDLIIQGRWSQGVHDAISRGRPTFSVYGKNGGFTETFIPEAAYRELVAQSASRRLILAEVPKGAGWTLWSISPADT